MNQAFRFFLLSFFLFATSGFAPIADKEADVLLACTYEIEEQEESENDNYEYTSSTANFTGSGDGNTKSITKRLILSPFSNEQPICLFAALIFSDLLLIYHRCVVDSQLPPTFTRLDFFILFQNFKADLA
jgi:hypothetical protein